MKNQAPSPAAPSPDASQKTDSPDGFVVPLDLMDLMEVSGEDSAKFLQGQLACNLDALASGRSCLGAACDSKGRVYASLRLARLAPSYYLAMPPRSLARVQDALGKYLPFYKAKLHDARRDFTRWGVAGRQGREILQAFCPPLPALNQISEGEHGYLLNVSDEIPRYELWRSGNSANELEKALSEALPQKSAADWELLDIQAGLFQLGAEAAGLYTPEVLNYDLAGHISFDKGCYTGQEIVARMHYRGKAKKRLYRISLETDHPRSEISLFDSLGNALGKSCKILKIKDKYEGLAILDRSLADAAGGGQVKDQEGQPVAVMPFHYAWAKP